MQLSESLSKVLTGIIEPLVRMAGLELVDIELRHESGRVILDVTVDKAGGISLNDCADLSRKVSLALDVEDPLPFQYHLQVGSPGIFRKLKSEREIARNLQARVKAVFNEPVSGFSSYIGILSRVENGRVAIRGEEQELSVDLQQIKKIQLFPDI